MSERALVAVGGGYGNIVMATPTIAAVGVMGYVVDVLVESHQPQAANLISGWDAVDTIYLDRGSLRRYRSQRDYDAVLRTVWNRGSPLQMGPEVRPDAAPLRSNHELLVNLGVARALGYTGPVPAPHVETEMPFWPLPDRFIAVAPGYGGVRREDWARKAWPHWPEFCGRCRARTGAEIIILGSEPDREPWMQDDAKPWLHNLCGRTSIRGAAGIISRAEALVAIDNGLAHIGAALGRPVVALFGPTTELKNRPFGPRVEVVAAEVDCRPCQMTERWEKCADYRCMREIGVEDVLSELEPVREKICLPSIAN